MKNTLGLRFAAFAIDYFAVCALSAVFIRLVGEPTGGGRYIVSGWPALLIPACWIWWFVILEWQASATLGKKVVGLRVERADGRALTFGGAFLRRFCDVVDFWLSFGLFALICHLKTEKGQRVGDMAAGTVVVRANKKEPNQALQPTAAAGRG
mgnify:CR=1 FL=1